MIINKHIKLQSPRDLKKYERTLVIGGYSNISDIALKHSRSKNQKKP